MLPGDAMRSSTTERRTRWYQSILLIQDSLHKCGCQPRSGPLRARFHLFRPKLSGAHPLLKSSDDPADLEMVEAGRGGPEDCACRNALLRRGGRDAEIVVGSMGGESVDEEGAVAASSASRDGEIERCKSGQDPQVAELPGHISRLRMSRDG